jgi:hypothetical protein
MLDELPDLQLRALASAAETYTREAFGAYLHLDPIKPLGLPHYLLDRYSLWKGNCWMALRPSSFRKMAQLAA